MNRVIGLLLVVCLGWPTLASAQFGLIGGGPDEAGGPGGQFPGGQFPGGPAGEGNAAAGGGAMADFDSLMQLIQTTVEPDTWEALGGVGTMAPYPAGILVDPSGLVQTVSTDAMTPTTSHDHLLRGLIAIDDSAGSDWRAATAIRCVSLRRMMQALAAVSASDERRDPLELESLAGLSRITLMILTEDDLILAGPVGGFQDVDGWLVDRTSGLPPMRLTSLAVAISACRSKTPYGCTIDPKPESLATAASVAAQVTSGEIPLGRAAESLAEALGRQEVRVFGTSAGHEVAWVMIEADRHMKQLALGVQPMPEGTRNLLQTIQTADNPSPPTDLLLRLWFTGEPVAARMGNLQSSELVQLAGVPVRLSGENELALLSGERGNRVVEPTTATFVDHFNDHWTSLQSDYPIYGALESIYQAAAIARVWTTQPLASASPDHAVLQSALMWLAARSAPRLAVPTEVDSIAVMHRYQRGRKLHHLIMASGGVSIDPAKLTPAKMAEYPSLAGYAGLVNERPVDRWWWNATRPE